MDIGESIVGAYMRYIRECEVVVYNTFLRDQQGELDVVALKTGEPRKVWLCEVTTHIGGMLYQGVGGADGTLKKLRDKLRTQRDTAKNDNVRSFVARKVKILTRLLEGPLPESHEAKATQGPAKAFKPPEEKSLSDAEILDGARYLVSIGKTELLTKAQTKALAKAGH